MKGNLNVQIKKHNKEKKTINDDNTLRCRIEHI